MGNNFCDLAFASLGSRSKKPLKKVFAPRVEISLLEALIPLEMEENENGRVASPDHLQDFQLFFVQHKFYFTFLPVSFSGL